MTTPKQFCRAIDTTMFVLSAGLISIGLITPAAAQHSSTGRLLRKDPSVKEYRHNGLPCSTVPIAAPAAANYVSPTVQLDKIERQTVSAVGGSSARASSSFFYRIPSSGPSDRQAPINFVYRTPAAARFRD